MDRSAGFTVIELLITILVVGILVTIGVVSPISALVASRDNTRADDITSIARRLEQDYVDQTTGSPEYPGTTPFISDATSNSGTASGTTPDIFRAPGATGISLVGATSNNATYPMGGSTLPVINTYYYQPLQRDGSLCTNSSSQICSSFRLMYVREKDRSVLTIKSMHQQ